MRTTALPVLLLLTATCIGRLPAQPVEEGSSHDDRTPQHVSRAIITDSALALYPLAIGNKWQYFVQTNRIAATWYSTVEVTGDTVMPNGKRYFILTGKPNLESPPVVYRRIDSSTGRIYDYKLPGTIQEETTWFSLGLDIRDSTRPSDRPPYGKVTIYNDTWFGMPTVVRSVFRGLVEATDVTYKLAYGLGFIAEVAPYYDQSSIWSTLAYARIGGKEYGTLMAAPVDPSSDKLTVTLSSENPIDDAVTLSIALPAPAHLQGRLFDMAGNLVATFLDKMEDAGEHRIRIDMHNHPPGVYLCHVRAGTALVTRKIMVQ